MQEITLPPTSNLTDEIRAYILPIAGNLFTELLASVQFETVGKGRQGAVLADLDTAGNTPIVRTTTRYSHPAQPWRSLHTQLARQIQTIAGLTVSFNHALVETYTNAYTKMGSHSDQALDLADESSIAIFSCYKYPESAAPLRQLIVETKESGDDRIEIPLAHNSVIVFSTATNQRLKHKIVLASAHLSENHWLGFTFRTSKTLVSYRDEHAYFADGVRLTLADDEQRREFYKLRSCENAETDFRYPRITYTLSESDLMSIDSR
jgi:hypothetical protein